MAKIEYLIIHCTATPEGREVTSQDIRNWHTLPPPLGRGWSVVGYTDMIHLNGSVERLVMNNEDANVDQWEITNGVSGINFKSRHIVYVGGLSKDANTAKDTRTPQQLESLKKYVIDFHKQFPDVKIKGHNEFAAKSCPSFSVQTWLLTIGIKQ